MIQLPDGIQVHLWTRPCDMRRGFDVLAQEAKHSSPEHDKAALVMIAELYRLKREFKEKLKEDKRELDPTVTQFH